MFFTEEDNVFTKNK